MNRFGTEAVKVLGLVAGLVLAVCAAGCKGHVGGRLIIAGGAVSAENAELYSRFFESLKPDAVVGIIPTASANPEESAASSARTLARYAGGRRIEPLIFTVQNSEAARDAGMAEKVRACDALWFTGGVQSRITQVFRPRGEDTPALAAMREVLVRGGVIGGTSAGAAMMSDPMITGGSSAEALSGVPAEGEDKGLGLEPGMGFFQYGLTDQHFLRRGRLGRLVVALERTGVKRGYGVDENAAIDVDLGSGVIHAVGRVLVVDASGLRREGRSITGVRISLLDTGDAVDANSGEVTGAEMGQFEPDKAVSGRELPAAWSRDAVLIAIQVMGATGKERVEMSAAGWRLRISRTERTQFWGRGERIRASALDLELQPMSD